MYAQMWVVNGSEKKEACDRTLVCASIIKFKSNIFKMLHLKYYVLDLTALDLTFMPDNKVVVNR